MSRVILISVSIAASMIALPAQAYDKLLGEYAGKIEKAQGGYRGKEGDACTARVSKSDRDGESVSFAINSEDPLRFPAADVTKALGAGTDDPVTLSVSRRGEGAFKVTMKFHGDGTMAHLQLNQRLRQQPSPAVIACGELKRK